MNIKLIPHPWTTTDIVDLERSQSFGCIAKIAIRVLSRLSGPVVMVSGPMTTGGRGSVEENLKAYRKAMAFLESKQLTVFNQLLAEDYFRNHSQRWRTLNPTLDYCWPILDDFYEPVFRSGKIKGLYFMPDWESSRGCNRERELAKKIPLEINDLAHNWEEQFALATV